MTSKKDLVGLGMSAQMADYQGFEPLAVTAAGTAVGTATGLPENASFVNVTTAASQDGIKFHNNWPLGRPVIVVNPNATTANIYPPTGANWNGGSTDATITLAQNKVRMFIRYSTTLCYSILTA